MSTRPIHEHGIKRGRIVDWPVDALRPEELAEKVVFKGNRIHKTYKSPDGQPALMADEAKCDKYRAEDWSRLTDVLRGAIRSRCIGQFRGEFPSKAWAFINDVLHEARLTNQEQGEYHGFPIYDGKQYPQPPNRLENAPRVTIAIDQD